MKGSKEEREKRDEEGGESNEGGWRERGGEQKEVVGRWIERA